MTPQHSRKLQTALIETGKEVEEMKETPRQVDIESEFALFMAAVLSSNMKDMRKHGRRLCALVMKLMIDKL